MAAAFVNSAYFEEDRPETAALAPGSSASDQGMIEILVPQFANCMRVLPHRKLVVNQVSEGGIGQVVSCDGRHSPAGGLCCKKCNTRFGRGVSVDHEAGVERLESGRKREPRANKTLQQKSIPYPTEPRPAFTKRGPGLKA